MSATPNWATPKGVVNMFDFEINPPPAVPTQTIAEALAAVPAFLPV